MSNHVTVLGSSSQSEVVYGSNVLDFNFHILLTIIMYDTTFQKNKDYYCMTIIVKFYFYHNKAMPIFLSLTKQPSKPLAVNAI